MGIMTLKEKKILKQKRAYRCVIETIISTRPISSQKVSTYDFQTKPFHDLTDGCRDTKVLNVK